MEESGLDVKNWFTLMLEDYLADESELAKTEAYRIGRRAASEGIDELQIVELFHSFVRSHLARTDGILEPERLKSAVDFLSGCLTPYEARNREYLRINDRLSRENRRLKSELEMYKRTELSLRRSKDYYQKLIDNSLDIVAVLNRDGAIRYISPSLKRVMGYEPDELVGQKIVDFIHPDSRSLFNIHFARLQKSRSRIRLSEFRFRSRDGSWRYLESNANYINDDSQGYIIVNSRDVTERVLAREKLKKREQQLSTAQAIARLGSWEWDFRNDTLKWTRELSRIYDIDHEEAPASIRNNDRVIHPDDRIKATNEFRKAVTDNGEIDFENRVLRPDGEERILHVRGEVIWDKDQRPVKLVGTGQDITDLKRVERKLQSYSDLLRKLSARQSRIREEERIRISREIHDELGQMLTVLKMELFLFKERAGDEGNNPFARRCVSEIGEMINRFDSIIESVQRITTDLRPEVLDTLGLIEAIEWQSRMFESKTGIRINFSNNFESSHIIDDERSTAAFRILQETLANIEEHSGATRVEVQLYREAQFVVLVVQDNGSGIPAEKVTSSESLGIIGMNERSQFLGGEITFQGDSDTGTTVTLKIPL